MPATTTDFREFSLFGFNQSGGSYLTNVLLELDVCIYSDDLQQRWSTEDHRRFELREDFRAYMGFYYPRFMEESTFTFPDGVGIRYNHDFPTAAELQRDSILLVRDPRGVLLSIHDRIGGGTELTNTLASNLERNGPNIAAFRLFDLYPAECWAVYYSLIRAVVPPERLHVVRFEDVREDPLPGFERLLEFIGVSRPHGRVLHAHERSGKEPVQRAGEAWRARYPERVTPDKCVKRRRTGGWDELWSPAALEALGPLARRVMRSFGYDAPAPKGPAPFQRPTHVDPSLALEGTAAFRAALVSLIPSLGARLDVALDVGLALRACDQVNALFPGAAADAPAARRALAHLVELYGHLEGRPLHALSAARGLQRAAGPCAASQALVEAAASSARSFGEHVDVALETWRSGELRLARKLLARARGALSAKAWSAFRAGVEGRSPAPWLFAELDAAPGPYALSGPRWMLSQQLTSLFLTGRGVPGPVALIDPAHRGPAARMQGVPLVGASERDAVRAPAHALDR